jgi:hypothetical protein
MIGTPVAGLAYCPFHDNSGTNKNWRVQSSSGSGSTVTGASAAGLTPKNWSADYNSSSGSDEAVWVITQNSETSSLEVGYATGWIPYDGNQWTYGLRAYSTIKGGTIGHIDPTGHTFGPQEYITAQAFTNGAFAVFDDNYSWQTWWTNYNVATPAYPMQQGEVTQSTNTWMGGGGGQRFYGDWTDNYGKNWYQWGYNDDCNDDPYWIQNHGPNSWANGGYGGGG